MSTQKWRAERFRRSPGARIVRPCILAALVGATSFGTLATEDAPSAKAFCVREQPLASGPRITPFLQYQTEQAWQEDEERAKTWDAIRVEKELLKAQNGLRQKLLEMIGGLPTAKTDLHAQVTGKIQMDGFSIEKLIFQSLPGVYVTALVYVP